MRKPLPATAVVILAGVLASCGATRVKHPVMRRVTDAGSIRVDADYDRDGLGEGAVDRDDADVMRFGKLAPASVARTIATRVERYAAAAAAGDGGAACPLVYSPVAESFVEERATAEGRSSASAGCAGELSAFFEQEHRRYLRDAARKVVGIRVEGEQAVALLSGGGEPLHHIFMRREGGSWKVRELWQVEMP